MAGLPTGLGISSETYQGYLASWTNDGPYDALLIYVREAGGSWDGGTSVNGLSSYSVSATEGITVGFRLFWQLPEDAGSGFTDEATSLTILRAPIITDATSISASEINWEWTNEAGTATSNAIEYAKTSGGGWSSQAAGPTDTDATISGLDAATQYKARVKCANSYTESGYSNEFTESTSNGAFSDAFSDTVTFSDSFSDAVAIGFTALEVVVFSSSFSDQLVAAESFSDTVTFTDRFLDSVSIHTDYVYYLGDDAGDIYEHSAAHKSDDGQAITSVWETIETDFGAPNAWKTVQRVNLKYVDRSVVSIWDYLLLEGGGGRPITEDGDPILTEGSQQATTFTVSISTDGGTNWTPQSVTAGTGDKKTHNAWFYFFVTSEYFKFKVEVSGTTGDFQIIGLDIDFQARGETFNVL